jgi:hypothetical protein
MSLMHVPSSRSYDHFQHNGSRFQRLKQVASAAEADSEEDAIGKIIRHFGIIYHDAWLFDAYSEARIKESAWDM